MTVIYNIISLCEILRRTKAMGKNIAKLLIVFVLIAAVVFAAFGTFTIGGFTKNGAFDEKIGIRQGLDLTGGSVITFEAEAESVTPEQMSTVVAVMRKRLDSANYTEATVAVQGEKRVRIEIPSVSNPDDAVKLLGQTAKLVFADADGNVVLDGADIKKAQKMYGQLSEMSAAENYVELTFNTESIQKFADATKAAANKEEGNNFIAIMLDETVVSAPRVDKQYATEGINSETAVISGEFTAEAAAELANLISAGQLPFSLKVVEQSAVGASLGETALADSIKAAAIGILLIMLLMLVLYRIPGLAADIALVAYIGLFVLLMGLFHTNLTLAGIAGVILTIGMAVDANVIIFERIKEEIQQGKTVKAAVGAGFKRAFAAIIDSNITTLIAAVVLYVVGVGTVKGFVITLGLGIIISMFTAIFVTRVILTQFAGIFGKSPKLYGGK